YDGRARRSTAKPLSSRRGAPSRRGRGDPQTADRNRGPDSHASLETSLRPEISPIAEVRPDPQSGIRRTIGPCARSRPPRDALSDGLIWSAVRSRNRVLPSVEVGAGLF